MRFRGLSATLALALSLALATATGAAEGDAAARCDALAASIYDPDMPPGSGVPFGEIDAAAAIAACTEALASAPDDARLRFQLGRALDQSGDTEAAIAAYEAAEAGGSLLASSALGSLYDHGNGVPIDAGKAVAYYRKAADGGLPLGLSNLGSMYENGVGVPQDFAKAAELYQQAADAGLALAAANLGYLYENGEGVPKDEVEAVRLYRIGADAGIDFALRNMGVMYSDGRGGLEQDGEQAVAYYLRAVEAGMPETYLDIAHTYSDGVGIPVDRTEAERYLRLAMEQGDEVLTADARNDLAWLLASGNERLDEAEELARSAVDADDSIANRLDTLAWILHLQGNSQEALPLMQRAVELEPDNAEFAEHLKAIQGS